MYFVLKSVWLPVIVGVTGFGWMGSIECTNFLKLVGGANRCGQYFSVANIRDFSPWINSLVVAGVLGAAICSDLGARKIREELDALEVLGVEPIRELVVPRIVSITLLAPMLQIISVWIVTLDVMFTAIVIAGVPVHEYWNNVFSNLTVTEIAGSLLKATIMGFVTGVICAYKGLSATGGSMGLGQAVNQAVVIAFVAVFTFSGVFNMVLLGLFPAANVLR
jgi:phospholipid/cholesterol/gamma-HCH transport system permease protein